MQINDRQKMLIVFAFGIFQLEGIKCFIYSELIYSTINKIITQFQTL